VNKVITNLASVLLVVLFVFGGLAVNYSYSIWFGLFISVLVLLWAIFGRKSKFTFPKGFVLFGVFLLTLILNILWIGKANVRLDYVLLFLSGGIFLVAFYNLRGQISKQLPVIIVTVGIVLGALYLFELTRPGELPIKSLSLYLPSNAWRNHNHLGDFWAIVLLILVYWNTLKPKLIHWILIFFGVFFLASSLSRSSYLALGVGVIYLFKKMGWIEKYKKILVLFLGLCLVWIIHSAFYKSILFSRPYFLQALKGLVKYPLGVGMGNFGLISTDAQIVGEVKNFSLFTHNIVLDILTGVGLMGLTFVTWLTYVLKKLIFSGNKDMKAVLPTAIFLAITANFFFDSTYVIPTMLWMWFISLSFALVNGDY